MKDNTFNSGIMRTYYKVMFGCDPMFRLTAIPIQGNV